MDYGVGCSISDPCSPPGVNWRAHEGCSHLFVPDDVALCASDVNKTSFFLLTLIVFTGSSNFSNTLALFLIQFEKMLQARYDSKVYFVAI